MPPDVQYPEAPVATAAAPTDDATRLRDLEASLRLRERQLEEAHRIANLGTWSWERSTNATTWSDEIYAIFGRTRETYTPRSVTELRNLPNIPASWLNLLDLHQRAIDTGAPYEADIEIERSDGSKRWIVSRAQAAQWENGQVVSLRGTVQDITDRKLNELALAERERDLNEAHRLARLGTWSWDRASDRLHWSDEVYRVFGRSPEEVPPSVAHLRTDPTCAAIVAAMDRTLATLEPYEIDIEIGVFDGHTRWITARGEPAAIVDGYVTGLRGTIQDITDRKLNELALAERERQLIDSQARFQRLYTSDLIGIGFPNAEGAILDGNDALLRTVGYTREDLDAGLVRWDLMTPPEYRDLDLAHIAESAARGSCTPYRKEYIRKDGTRVPVMVGFARLQGERAGSIGFVMDLSAQQQAEEASREREQRFSALAESLPQLVWASDPNGDRIYVNGRYCDYTGMAEDDLMGSRWKDYLHPDDLPRTNDLWLQSMNSGEPYLNEYRIRRHDGMYRSFLVRANPVRNQAGEIERWLGSATDIHDQKLAEEALRRTEKLAATGRLAASIAHEINNPLEAVTNALYLALMDTSLPQDTRTYLKMAEQELARVAQVTTQTLRFHRQSVAAAHVDLAEVMDSAFSLFGPRFEACHIQVLRDYTPGQLLYCRADELRQVFANFLSNALDATRQGGRVRIRIRPCTTNAGPALRVTIADTGHGIPPHLRKSIFEPFISTKEATGTGLGLWVSDGIVQKHRGRIALRSRTYTPHQGTVFSLFFPLDGIPTA